MKQTRSNPHILAALLALTAGMIAATPACAQTWAQLTPEQRALAKSFSQRCKPDIQRYCPEVRPGNGRIVDCLDRHERELSPACHDALPTARQFRDAQMHGNG